MSFFYWVVGFVLFFNPFVRALWVSQVALEVRNSTANAGDAKEVGLIPGSGRSPGVGNGNRLQDSCLEKFNGQRSLLAIVHGISKSQTRLSD